eukprot:CAMPEP_0201511226 /NCGR_PEP_ID=MMETSP0161_2-20130828/3707_1 /ASSEMBLY_ACC=CAM_ASM_000251 /TAXON_ID=180227 /ORGANISM="Neoparamoeba aestuarina, Strain SoJaBio B1-5/56/2" /LENGTH=141 /DNA_ID=CAMNT_0047906625 /DNA_START=291 /DNA_END=716 /DNA_ORIENTATION=+
MANVDDPSLEEAYDAIRKTDVNWIVVGYEGRNKLVVQGKGSGGFAELQGALDDKQCQFGLIKVTYVAAEDAELGFQDNQRVKYAFFSFAGPNASALKRGKISVHKADLKKIFREFSIEIQASEKSELEEATVLHEIKRVNY